MSNFQFKCTIAAISVIVIAGLPLYASAQATFTKTATGHASGNKKLSIGPKQDDPIESPENVGSGAEQDGNFVRPGNVNDPVSIGPKQDDPRSTSDGVNDGNVRRPGHGNGPISIGPKPDDPRSTTEFKRKRTGTSQSNGL